MIDTNTKVAHDAESTDPDTLIERLLQFEPVPAPVISLYLDARVDATGQRTFLPFVRKQLTERGKSYPSRSPERESFEEDFVRIVRYLENDIPSTTQGLAIFACASANDFFEIGAFDAPFERNRLFVLDRPQVYGLARLNGQYRRYAVVLADTNRAQIFVFAAGRTVEQEQIKNTKTKQTKVGGWSQARYQRHTENYHLQHAKEVVDNLERLVNEEQIEHIILAGDQDVVIPILREQLPKALSEKVVDVLSLSIDTPEHELLEHTLKAFRAYDSLADSEKVEQLLNEFRADNLAVAGVFDTLAALSNGQVDELLIASSPQSLSYDPNEVEKVLQAYDGGDGLPETFNQQTIANELVSRAKQLSAAKITFIEDATRLAQVGGVGALLRYRISEQSAAPYEQAGTTARSEALTQKV